MPGQQDSIQKLNKQNYNKELGISGILSGDDMGVKPRGQAELKSELK